MEGLKIVFLVLTTLSCCLGAPGIVRNDASLQASHHGKAFDTKVVSDISPQDQEDEEYILTANGGDLDQDFSLGELLKNGISTQISYREEQMEKSQLFAIPSTNPSKLTRVELYEECLASLFKRMMNRDVFQAEIIKVNVEDMGHGKIKQQVYYYCLN